MKPRGELSREASRRARRGGRASAAELITVDIGNTRISWARHRGGRPIRSTVAPRATTAEGLAAQVRRAWRALGLASGSQIAGVVISSVVPTATAPIAAALRGKSGISPQIFPRDFRGCLEVRPRPARRVGADRLANALGALSLRASDAIVVDVGTAVTVDLVRADGVFEGGAIAPGPRLGARALHEYTAQLPLVPFVRARSPIGTSTRTAIAAGLWHGYRGLVAELVRQAHRGAPAAQVVVAGGDGAACLRGSGIRARFVPDLTHRGLAAAFANRRSSPR
ncbi:MAG: type III pantothenate kinase [Planctomycetes bacterium]|nr:type III pantothenate kinase [Planctomycetota bacterium]